MASLLVALTIFTTSIGAAFVGLALHVKLPDHHLDSDSRDVVKLVIGLIATMAALVLGLLVASAQSSYTAQSSNLQKLAADVAQLDHALAVYGPEANDARQMLRQVVSAVHDQIWSAAGVATEHLNPIEIRPQADKFLNALVTLSPKTDTQRFTQSQALQQAASIGQTRSLMFEQANSSVSWPFIVVLMFWLSVLFLGFGLLARLHATVAAALVVGALSVAASVFLILELGSPYSGIIRLSDQPLRIVIDQLIPATS